MSEHRFAVALAAVTFFLLILGGIVHNTGSSLACPDWPLCYGSLFPEMKGGVAIEHGHRLLAAAVGLMSIVLAVFLQKRRGGDTSLCRLGWAAVFLVIFQGILGGLTVLYRLPSAISTAHLAISMLFFSIVILIVWRTSPSPHSTPHPASRWLLATTFLVYCQNVLGALVRHTASGLVCPDIPFCYGFIWPVGLHPSLVLHMAHRWNGVLVTLFVLPIPFLVKDRLLALVPPVLVVVQIGLGVASVITSLSIMIVTLHLAAAVLLLATMVSLSVQTL